jgi:hypothetical protein
MLLASPSIVVELQIVMNSMEIILKVWSIGADTISIDIRLDLVLSDVRRAVRSCFLDGFVDRFVMLDAAVWVRLPVIRPGSLR